MDLGVAVLAGAFGVGFIAKWLSRVPPMPTAQPPDVPLDIDQLKRLADRMFPRESANLRPQIYDAHWGDMLREIRDTVTTVGELEAIVRQNMALVLDDDRKWAAKCSTGEAHRAGVYFALAGLIRRSVYFHKL